MNKHTNLNTARWAARIALGAVFFLNVQCAVQFILWPNAYAPAYALSGVPGAVAIQGIGVAFLMWNTTYPIAIANPEKHRGVFAIVLAQQLVGLVGESAILIGIPAGFEVLAASILRFIVFDAAGLVVMGAAFAYLTLTMRRVRETDEERLDRA